MKISRNPGHHSRTKYLVQYVKSQPNFLTKFLNLAKNLRLSHKVISWQELGENSVQPRTVDTSCVFFVFCLFVCFVTVWLLDSPHQWTHKPDLSLLSPFLLVSFWTPGTFYVTFSHPRIMPFVGCNTATLRIGAAVDAVCAQYYACKYTSKNPCDLIEAVPLLRAASNLVSEERHSTSNDDNYYTDMPDLLTDDEETDDEESVN